VSADLEALRSELVDVETALEEGEAEDAVLLGLARRREQILAELEPERPAPDPEDYRPAGQDLVISPDAPDHEVFVVLDAHDEDLILQELQRRALKVLLYDFPKDGSRIVDLSYAGVLECVRLLNATGKVSIRIRPDTREVRRESIDGVEYVTATVYAEDGKTGMGVFGTAREPLRMRLKPATAAKLREKGTPVDSDNRTFDPFAETKALNKAQRNAMKATIPERMRQTLIAMARQDEAALQTIQHGAGAESRAELPPPLSTPEALALTAECRSIYDRIRSHPGGLVGPLSLLPGQYGAQLERAAHDEAQLQAFRDSLLARLEKIEAAS
jgi:hypothetical protein